MVIALSVQALSIKLARWWIR